MRWKSITLPELNPWYKWFVLLPRKCDECGDWVWLEGMYVQKCTPGPYAPGGGGMDFTIRQCKNCIPKDYTKGGWTIPKLLLVSMPLPTLLLIFFIYLYF